MLHNLLSLRLITHICLQLFGHQRSPSMEFKELTKKDAQLSLAMELDKLLRTMPAGNKQIVEQDFDGFKKLFGKFVNETGPSVHWDRIEKLPQDAVRPFHSAFIITKTNYRFFHMPAYLRLMIRKQFARCSII